MTYRTEALREEIARALGRHYGDESNWVAWEAEADALLAREASNGDL